MNTDYTVDYTTETITKDSIIESKDCSGIYFESKVDNAGAVMFTINTDIPVYYGQGRGFENKPNVTIKQSFNIHFIDPAKASLLVVRTFYKRK